MIGIDGSNTISSLLGIPAKFDTVHFSYFFRRLLDTSTDLFLLRDGKLMFYYFFSTLSVYTRKPFMDSTVNIIFGWITLSALCNCRIISFLAKC